MNRRTQAVKHLARAMTLSASLAVSGVTQAEDATDTFYRSRTISIYVGLPAGGTFDAYARLTAAHLSGHVPGHPNVIVQNMPGAGSLQAANFVYNRAPQDGSVIGAMSSNVPIQPLLDASGVNYDSLKMNWLPTPSHAVSALVVWHTSSVKSFEDLRTHEALLGTLAPGSSPTIAIGLYKHVLGAKVRAILGYQGLPAVMLAMERGEVNGYSTVPVDVLQNTYGQLWKSGQLRVLAQTGSLRDPLLADVPSMGELAATQAAKQIITLGTASSRMTFPYVMGPGVPPARVTAMRSAFTQMLGDSAFLADAAARHMTIAPVGSEEVQAIIREIYATPPEIVQQLKDIVALQGK